MKTLDLKKAKDSLSSYARCVAKEPMILTVRGKPVAALVSIQNADLETVKLSTDPNFIAIIERSRARHKSEGGISSDAMRQRLGVSRPLRRGRSKPAHS